MSKGLRTYRPEELLGRAPHPTGTPGARELIEGRKVLVTGAAGSVGTPLVHVLAEMHPAELLLLDHHEHTLFRLRIEMGPSPAVPVRLWLADVRDRRKLGALFKAARPDIVLHLAAYKHVPLGEENPDQTAEVNLGGTRALIEASAEHGVRRFVYPSSDKAVNPPSVYGSTKKLAEELTLAADRAREMPFMASMTIRWKMRSALSAIISPSRPFLAAITTSKDSSPTFSRTRSMPFGSLKSELT